MSIYKSKQQLLDDTSKEEKKLRGILASLRDEQCVVEGVCEKWSIKDIVAHLVEWESMVFSWYKKGKMGETPEVPAPGFKWSQLPALNEKIYQNWKDVSLKKVMDSFDQVHKTTMSLINSIPEKDMLIPGKYPWMNKNALIAYFGSATSSHFKWASTLIKKWLKTQK